MINYPRSGHGSALSLQDNWVIFTSLAIAYFEVGQRHCLVRLACYYALRLLETGWFTESAGCD
ncbi:MULTISPECIES: hypothetical protein [unclassified Microcoleus]|uniref:hypothetical protein n=1 Tax=unclassified Microcoleus TaxID=2642155 RepID=UPI002FD433B8